MIDSALSRSPSLVTATPPIAAVLEDTVDSQKQVDALLAEVNALSTQLRQPARSANAEDQLLAAEVSVLQIVEKLGPQTVPRIARARLTSRQNIQVLVNRLIAAGCLEANRNPRHKRSVVIGLAARGKNLLATAANHHEQIVREFSMRVPAKKLREAVEILNQLRASLTQASGRTMRPNHPRTRSTESDSEKAPSASNGVQPEEDQLPVSLL
jgi:DNA-binding MarR family transcriptional regulator